MSVTYDNLKQQDLVTNSVIASAIKGTITTEEAARRLGISIRHAFRLKRKIKESGILGLVHGKTGIKPPTTKTQKLKDKIISLKYSDDYKDSNFTHFRELLLSNHNIKISYTCMYNILKDVGISSPKTRRRAKKHSRRQRRAQEGSLLQMDASPHDWFSNGSKNNIHGIIDDATGKITGLYMTKNECSDGYLEALRYCFINYGIPSEIYTDRHTMFQSPLVNRLSIEDKINGASEPKTQLSSIFKQLGIHNICARSPQAKGRIERLWGTLQSRLPVEFKLAGIDTIEEANIFLIKYLKKFNKQFAVEPEDKKPAFVPLLSSTNLDNILCFKFARKLDNGFCFSFKGQYFKVVNPDFASPGKLDITVLVSNKFPSGFRILYNNKVYEATHFIKTRKGKYIKVTNKKSTGHPQNHKVNVNSLVYDQAFASDDEIKDMLNDIFGYNIKSS